jgi:molybdopterin-containing oxidoreductase family molybdopterin binding subunit
MLSSLAIHFLNVIVGAIDVPGGFLGVNPVGPFWGPHAGPDGILVADSSYISTYGAPFPPTEVKAPQSLNLKELFPICHKTHPFYQLTIPDPGKFRLSYGPEMMLHCRSNLMMSSVNPKLVENALKKIPFMVSFAYQIDETVEFADIVFPDAHDFERVDLFPANIPRAFIVPGPGVWHWQLRKPVVEPAIEARHWGEVLLEIADRVGFLEELFEKGNTIFHLKEPYKLDPRGKYSQLQIVERQIKSNFGQEYGLTSLQNASCIRSPKKTIEQAFPRPFLDARIPIYLEHFKKAGEAVKKVTEDLGLDWDISDYQPLPDWKPCPAYEESPDGYDLFAANFKLSITALSISNENPWINELCEHHPYAYKILISSETAFQKGLKDGDEVWIESTVGRVSGRVKVTEGVHPEVVGIPGTLGHWSVSKPISKDKGVHWNSLLPLELERIDMLSGSVDSCFKVKIYKS